MDMPHTLRRLASGALVYTISLWYRLAAAAALGLLVAAIATVGGTGVIGWIFVAGAFIAAFYEERWTFDPARGLVSSRIGLVFLARRRTYAASELTGLSIQAFRRGLVDQSRATEPTDENAEARRGRGLEWRLLGELADGSLLVIDAGRSRGRERLAAVGARLAEAMGKPFGE